MSLEALETKWRKSLISILKELTEQQLKNLLFRLNKIPQGVKDVKSREEIIHLIIQYYGPEGSIDVIDNEMKKLPRKDAAVQDQLRPMMDKLSIHQQTTKEKKNEPGPSATEPNPAAGQQVVPPDEKKSDDQPAGGVLESPTQSANGKTEKVDPVESDPDPAEPAEPAEPAQTSEPQAAPVPTVSLKILGVKSSNKINTHLLVDIGGELRMPFITTRRLVKAFGFGPEEDLTQRISPENPLAAEAKIQGNKITDIKMM